MMKAIHRMLSDIDTLTINCLQECTLLKKSPDLTTEDAMSCLVAVGAITAISGAVHGARLALKIFE